MTKHMLSLTVLALAAAVVAACDQTEVVFPDAGAAGEGCGVWYAGGAADAGPTEYAFEEGATLPCLVWTSVRQNGADTWFNAGELYLEVLNGLSDKKAIVMVLSGTGCPACLDLIAEIAALKGLFESDAVMIGAAVADPSMSQPFTIDEAVDLLVGNDGWPADWMVTNDIEGYLQGYESFPWVVVVRTSDMQVVSHSNQTYSEANVTDLLALVQSFE
jgi:hypothetical protein